MALDLPVSRITAGSSESPSRDTLFPFLVSMVAL